MLLIKVKTMAEGQGLEIGTNVLTLVASEELSPERPFPEAVPVKIVDFKDGIYVGVLLVDPGLDEDHKAGDVLHFGPDQIGNLMEIADISKSYKCTPQDTGD